MKASILFVSYNHGRFAAKAIRSAMAQDYPDLELVVCDDASPDGTRAILEKELEQCPPHVTVVRAHSETNIGLISNLNRGVAACSGDIIIAMAGDDISLPNRVSVLAEEFAKNPNCMLVYSNWTRIDDDGRPLPGACKRRQDQTFSYALDSTCVYAGGKGPGSTAAYRADIFKTFGPLEVYKRPEDRSYWVRALLLGEIRYLAEPLVKWRTHSANLSNYQGGTDTAAARERILKDLLNRQSYGRQFRKDIEQAMMKSLIPQTLADRLLFIIRHDRERERLRRLSLAEAPWKPWLGAARRLMRCSTSIDNLWRIIRSDLPIRLSRKRREGFWKRKIKKGQD